jgi:LacI family transcriptional regulator
MIDVAQLAGVGLKTVSRVVNNESGVRAETAERVRAAIAELGFQRNEMASNLRARRSAASVGLVIEDLANPFYSVIARGVEQLIRERGFILITASSEEDMDRERELLLELAERRVVGMIIVPTGLDHAFLQHEIDRGLELVFLDRPPTGLSADNVLLDNRGGAAAAIEHLVSLGHERIAVVGHDAKIWTMQERLAGYRSTIHQHGLDIDQSLIKLGPLTPDEAAVATAELLDDPNPPTAFFGCNNRMTIGILWELRRRGLDADVAGFDDLEAAALFHQSVTLVSYDTAEIGRAGARLLLERLDGRRTPKEVVIPTTLAHYGIDGETRRPS